MAYFRDIEPVYTLFSPSSPTLSKMESLNSLQKVIFQWDPEHRYDPGKEQVGAEDRRMRGRKRQ